MSSKKEKNNAQKIKEKRTGDAKKT